MEFTTVYIIYSADVLSGDSAFIEHMSPTRHMAAGYSEPEASRRMAVAAKFWQSEDDEQYEFGYLAEGGCADYLAYHPDSEDETPGRGQHRKWVAELSAEEWLLFADSYQIDLDESGIPEESYVSNREGWDTYDSVVLESEFFVSFGG